MNDDNDDGEDVRLKKADNREARKPKRSAGKSHNDSAAAAGAGPNRAAKRRAAAAKAVGDDQEHGKNKVTKRDPTTSAGNQARGTQKKAPPGTSHNDASTAGAGKPAASASVTATRKSPRRASFKEDTEPDENGGAPKMDPDKNKNSNVKLLSSKEQLELQQQNERLRNQIQSLLAQAEGNNSCLRDVPKSEEPVSAAYISQLEAVRDDSGKVIALRLRGGRHFFLSASESSKG